MGIWNPWRGCHRCSEGCLHCYIHKGDAKRGIDTNEIVKTKDFDKPIRKKKNGDYSMKAGFSYLCFQSDFFLEDADSWRMDCWKMIKERQDITFLFLTKRILRFYDCIPEDWNEGYPNVMIYCTIENQAMADLKLPFFQKLPIRYKGITLQPLLTPVTITPFLSGIQEVVVGGESDYAGRPMDYDWVLSIRKECITQNVSFTFRQCSTNFIKDKKMYHLPTRELMAQARKANINYLRKKD
jgi:protein gp37